MGERGLVGFRINGHDKTAYTHWGAHWSSGGVYTLKFLREHTRSKKKLEALRKQVRELRVVTEETPPTLEDIARLKAFGDDDVGNNGVKEWYGLLRETQGKVDKILETGVILDAHEFINDSLMCEGAYIINFDDDVYEVYKGFQSQPHRLGRYSTYKPPKKAENFGLNPYYACALTHSFKFSELPTVKQFEELLTAVDKMAD